MDRLAEAIERRCEAGEVGGSGAPAQPGRG